MSIPPNDAALALAEMQARREQVVDTNLVPNWFWSAVGVLMILFVAAIESEIPWLIAVGSMTYALGLGAVIIAVVRKAKVQVRYELIGPRGILTILGFAAVLIALGLALGFTLDARDVPFAATVAIVPVAVGMALGGPRLMSHLRGLMLSRPLAGTR
ncbi:hypothetical protein [Actinoplanes derwentensis]|uniref:Uncharacterized protein n=1 Tax=Actinoplanes derwentensis TaxID=113562 RepID=A0A1H1ZG80_9ACTN|nr:hypothetical protein [Actinoplanes derwentensis]GID82429.1 hypothetical protein Ade03nite_13530 [Actinoplanes derwentensis]SDT32771.1 hypothetical protein SAMN04489716_3310 [Actinoplanes derwentensis]